jgi:hypothetical protein
MGFQDRIMEIMLGIMKIHGVKAYYNGIPDGVMEIKSLALWEFRLTDIKLSINGIRDGIMEIKPSIV